MEYADHVRAMRTASFTAEQRPTDSALNKLKLRRRRRRRRRYSLAKLKYGTTATQHLKGSRSASHCL